MNTDCELRDIGDKHYFDLSYSMCRTDLDYDHVAMSVFYLSVLSPTMKGLLLTFLNRDS